MMAELRPYQKAASNAAVQYFRSEEKRKHKYCGGLIVLPTGCHAKGYRVMMYDGSLKAVEEVRIGDRLLGVDNTPRTVLQLHHGEDEMYKIMPQEGKPFVVNGGHILSLYNSQDASECTGVMARMDEISVNDFLKEGERYKDTHKLYRAGQAKQEQQEMARVTGFSVEPAGRGEYYGFTLDGDHLYIDEQHFVHHNSGKSHVIADIAHRLDAPILIFAPSKELLLQDYEKMERIEKGISTMYSASVGQKKISMITFATIGSAIRHIDDFDVFRFILVDEAHDISSDGGMYERFIHHREDRKVVGLTATPYRLERDTLKFLTRTRPRIFGKMLYYCQITDLLSQGYLAHVTYYDLTTLEMGNIRSNSTGSDYDDRSIKAEYERSGFYNKLSQITLRVLNPKDGTERNGILVFTRFTKEADQLVQRLTQQGVKAASVSADTPAKERERLVDDFRNGKIKVIVNVGIFIKGFDYPELDTVIFARPTKSLAIWYQAAGRALRPFPNKKAWVIDLAGTYRRFGKISDLKIELEKPNSELWAIFSKGRKLTNTTII